MARPRTTHKETKCFQAYNDLLDDLREVGERHLGLDNGVEDELDIAEGIRNILHLLSAATDFYLEGDPDRPEFVKIVSPTRKIMGDNPDAIYYFSRLRGDRTYRVRGRKKEQCYISFTVHGRAEDGRLGAAAEPVLADVNDRAFEMDSDGSFEIIFSPDEHPGNWVKLDPTAASLLVRNYYELETAAAADPGIKVELSIECLDDVPVREPLSDGVLAARLADVAAFVRGATIDTFDMTQLEIPFVSRVPNELPQPSVFRQAGSDSWGAVDIAYAMCPFELEDEEALVMQGCLPACAFANVVLWNKWMQCFEFRDRRVSLNRKQIDLDADGRYRIVIAARDPGVGNWLDTEGHARGTIFWRFLLPEEQPEKPECRVVPLADLTG